MTSHASPAIDTLPQHLAYLKLPFITEQAQPMAQEAAQARWSHLEYLARLIEGEALERQRRAVQRRIRQARFPVVKTMESFQWNWPKKIERLQVQHLFHFQFIEEKANVIFLGGVGLGKTHLATALGYAACQKGYSVLFATAVDVINTLASAQRSGRLKQEMAKYSKPDCLILDELGYLPIDKIGADLLFQIISYRYERGATVITTNRVFNQWPQIFNNDSTLTSALLDRLLHHAQTIVIEGKSYRMREKIDD